MDAERSREPILDVHTELVHVGEPIEAVVEALPVARVDRGDPAACVVSEPEYRLVILLGHGPAILDLVPEFADPLRNRFAQALCHGPSLPHWR